MATFTFAKYDGQYFSDTLSGDIVISTASDSNTIRMGVNNNALSSVQFSPGDITFTNQIKLVQSNDANKFITLKCSDNADLVIQNTQNETISENVGFDVKDLVYKLNWLQFDSNTNTISTTCNVDFGSGETATVTSSNLASLSISNDLEVYGNSYLSNDLIVTGPATFSNDVTVLGTASLSDDLIVTGPATFSNDLTVLGTASLSNDLIVTGPATFSNDVTVLGLVRETVRQTDALNVVSTPIVTSSNFYRASTIQMQSPRPVSNVELFGWSEDIYSIRLYDNDAREVLYTSPWLSNREQELFVVPVNQPTSQFVEVHARAVFSNEDVDNAARIVNTSVSIITYGIN